jgi:hypothetical protein
LDDGKTVSGIGSGISIEGIGTFKFAIEDDTGQTHTIRIPNSLYVPSLKRVLLAPQHWAQEARDHQPQRYGTWMATYDDCIELQWDQRKFIKTVPYNASTNTPVFRTASGTKSYRAYIAVIEALRACTPHFRHEQVIQRPGQPHVTPDDDEFIAEENLLLPEDYYKQPSEGASADDATVKHDNLSSEGASGNTVPDTARMGPLLCDPRPAVYQDDELTAPDDQTELMRWHYRLGHFSFPKLRLIALIGEIPKRWPMLGPPCVQDVLLAP